MNKYSRLHLIEIDDKLSLLFDRESHQMFPLDLSENKQIIDAVSSEYKSPEEITILSDIIKTIESGPASSNCNQFVNKTPQFTSLVLPITGKCNLMCSYCFAQANNRNLSFVDYTEDSINKLLSVLRNINGNTPTNLVFFGGEPLIKFDLIKYTVNKVKTDFLDMNIRYSITTNGTLINKEIAKFFADNNVSVLLSMDGFDNEYNYRKYKNGKPSVNRVIKAMDVLRENNVAFQVRATLTSDNPYLWETHQFFDKLHVYYQITFAYSSENKAHAELNKFSPQNLQSIKECYEKLLYEYKYRITNNLPIYDYLYHELSENFECRTLKHTSCSAGIKYFTILANGDIHYCAHLMNNPKYIIGNLFSHSYPESFENIEFTPKPVSKIPECNTCWAKYLCSGGCASQKIAEGLKSTDRYTDEKCNLEKLQYEFYLKLYCYKKMHDKKIAI